MSKISQKQAVFNAVASVLAEAGVDFNEGTNVNTLMTREFRAQVNAILFDAFQAGSVELDKTYATDADLRKYVSGLQSNWLRKDSRLNGGVAYTPKNPGSRVGSSDPQLKAMRALLASGKVTSTSEIAEINSLIEGRVEFIQANKKSTKKPVKVDFDALPAGLQKYASI